MHIWRDVRGVALVEAALTIPLMLLVILGGLDLGLAMLAASRLQYGTQAAAICALAKDPRCGGDPPIPTDVKTFALTAAGIGTFSVASGGCGTQITGNYTYVPTLIPYNIPLNATACY
jgi:uncharacterized membrane protein